MAAQTILRHRRSRVAVHLTANAEVEAPVYCRLVMWAGGDPPAAEQDPDRLHIVHVTAEMAPIAKVNPNSGASGRMNEILLFGMCLCRATMALE